MKIVAFVVALIAFLCIPMSALADGVPSDPRITIGGGVAHPTGIVVPDFGLKSPSGTSPATSPCILTQGGASFTSPNCSFENDINSTGVGQPITNLAFVLFGISPSTVSCGFLAGSLFSMCSVIAIPAGGTEVTFSDGAIPFQNDFGLDLVGFPSNFSIAATAATSVAPEPSSLLLVGTGLLGVAARRRNKLT